ncbi:hypothetical protein [Microcystis aeruginosa]|uniref:Uncharacterized protein n=1 Tax=Microcystis aeruginosa PCC 9443 TaxID=1160281 RepID=I4G6P5_MICAE|nr:hypothetical protein [Microcystis aeruginosa]CCI03606.1 conserved hypothetical protein [Microcystis aeruginosa PCC 9443]
MTSNQLSVTSNQLSVTSNQLSVTSYQSAVIKEVGKWGSCLITLSPQNPITPKPYHPITLSPPATCRPPSRSAEKNVTKCEV